ncbi:MAG TPA: hypothetical protein VF590_08660, partial [Isosphaeraceae bacterium]
MRDAPGSGNRSFRPAGENRRPLPDVAGPRGDWFRKRGIGQIVAIGYSTARKGHAAPPDRSLDG